MTSSMASMSSSGQASLYWEPVDEKLLRTVYDADQTIYPAPDLTFDRLQSWVAACPELSLCLLQRRSDGDDETRGGDFHGVIIVLPLRKACWEKLLAGDIQEHHVDAEAMFPQPSPSSSPSRRDNNIQQGDKMAVEVGLHVFHIERSSPQQLPALLPAAAVGVGRQFTHRALTEVRSRVAAAFPSWDVVGYSALTATPQGNAAFARLGFAPSRSSLVSDGVVVGMKERRGNDPFH